MYHTILKPQIPTFPPTIQVHQGVTLYFYPGESNALQVLLGTTTAQDLQVDLGPPIRVHYKEDDRMTIHATNQLEENKTQDCKPP